MSRRFVLAGAVVALVIVIVTSCSGDALEGSSPAPGDYGFDVLPGPYARTWTAALQEIGQEPMECGSPTLQVRTVSIVQGALRVIRLDHRSSGVMTVVELRAWLDWRPSWRLELVASGRGLTDAEVRSQPQCLGLSDLWNDREVLNDLSVEDGSAAIVEWCHEGRRRIVFGFTGVVESMDHTMDCLEGYADARLAPSE